MAINNYEAFKAKKKTQFDLDKLQTKKNMPDLGGMETKKSMPDLGGMKTNKPMPDKVPSANKPSKLDVPSANTVDRSEDKDIKKKLKDIILQQKLKKLKGK